MPRPGDEVGHLGDVTQDLGAGALVVGTGVRVVGVLIREVPVGMFGGQVDRSGDRAVRAFLTGREDQLGAEDLEHLATLDRHDWSAS